MIKDKEEGIQLELVAPYHKIAKKVLEKLQEEFRVMALVVFGSVVEKVPEKDSDLDLLAIVQDRTWGVRSFVVDGIPVELFIYNLWRVVKGIFQGQDVYVIRNIGAGKIFYTENPLMLTLKEFSEAYYKRGPLPKRDLFIFYERIMFSNAIDEVRRKCEDDAEKLYLLNWIYFKAVASYYHYRIRWLPKWSYLFPELLKDDSYMYNLCKGFLSEQNIDKKYEIIKEMVEYVLKPTGGYPKGSWQLTVTEEIKEL
jgi:hypothetical protein